MLIKEVNRTIHPATHKSKNPYRVKIGKKNFYDKLIVNISHAAIGKVGSFEFERDAIALYESIHFKAEEHKGNVQITWVQSIAVKRMIL